MVRQKGIKNTDQNLLYVKIIDTVHFVRQIYINLCWWTINQWDSPYEQPILSENSDLAVLSAIYRIDSKNYFEWIF